MIITVNKGLVNITITLLHNVFHKICSLLETIFHHQISNEDLIWMKIL